MDKSTLDAFFCNDQHALALAEFVKDSGTTQGLRCRVQGLGFSEDMGRFLGPYLKDLSRLGDVRGL